MKLSSYIIVGLALASCLCASCGNNKKSKDGRTDTSSTGTVSFVSDESFSPIIDEEREVFEHDYPEAHVNPIYTNESDAMKRLLAQKTWLAFTSRDFKQSEYDYLRGQQCLPQAIKIGYDGLALIVNKSNKDTLLSATDFKNIMTGKATKWNELGSGTQRGVITVVFDNPKSSTVHYVEDSILGGHAITNPNVVAVNKTAEVIKYVEEHTGTIGIIGNNWLNDRGDTTNLTFNRNIRVMSVSKVHPAKPGNSVKPYQYYLYDDEYPFIRTIYALLNDPRRALPTTFAHFVENPKGQLIIFKAGLLPFRGDLRIRDVKVSQ